MARKTRNPLADLSLADCAVVPSTDQPIVIPDILLLDSRTLGRLASDLRILANAMDALAHARKVSTVDAEETADRAYDAVPGYLKGI